MRPVTALPESPAFGVTLKAGPMGPGAVKQWTITVTSSSDTTATQVRISGAIDLSAEAALDEAVAQLHVAARPIILVDLSGVTFTSSTLINFLARIRDAMPAAGDLVISQATAQTRRLLTLTGLDAIVVLDDGLPIAA